MVKIRLRGLVALLTEKHLRRPFHMIEGIANFKRSKAALLEKMPLPRRKKWWEKLSEHQHDHFYDEAVELLPSVPRDFSKVYSLIVEHCLMHNVLTIQRYIKKRGLERWLVSQNPENRDWQNKFLVNVQQIDTLGEESRGTSHCTLF